MPIYEYECPGCGTRFEELVSAGSTPPCPRCGGADVTRVISSVAPPPRIGLRGAEARRMEARRSDARERGRSERRDA